MKALRWGWRAPRMQLRCGPCRERQMGKYASRWRLGCGYSGAVSRPYHCAEGRMGRFSRREGGRRWHPWQRAAGRDQTSVRDVS